MGERQKGSNGTEDKSQRPKRRRLNSSENQQLRKSNSTPTRSSPRLGRKIEPSQKESSGINWEEELPNATVALDRAICRIASRGKAETRDLCDEIADYLTQALFEDVWGCSAAEKSRSEPKSGLITRSGAKEEATETKQRANELPKERKAAEVDNGNKESKQTYKKNTDVCQKVESVPQNAPLDVVVLDASTPPRRKSEKRRNKGIQKSQSQRRQQVREKQVTANSRTHQKIQGSREEQPAGRSELPTCNGGLVEEVVEIEEAVMDGEFASERKKKKYRSKKLLGSIEEQVLDRSGSDSAADSEMNDVTPRKEMISRLPWWRVSDHDLSTSSKSEKEILRSYVTAIIRTCVRESWNAETLRESYGRDPASNRGQAFQAVHTSLRLLERARHMKECETRWRPELMRELLQRQEVAWSSVRNEKKFDQFAGCDACLGHRRATARIWLKGKRYDASDFWPGTSRIHILSAEEVGDRKLSVTAEIRSGTTNDHLIRIGANEDDTEFWVDSQCLRRCLLFHELVHSTATIARDFRRVIERELGNGTVDLRLSSKDSKGNGECASERLERFLLRSVLHGKEYVRKHVSHLVDIIRLGDVYFSSPDAEVLDSGKPGKSVYVPNIYDAPLELGDEEYRPRINEVVARSRRRRQSRQQST